MRNHPVLAFGLASVLLCSVLYGRLLQAPFVYDDFDGIVRDPSLLSWHALISRFVEHAVTLSNVFRGQGGLTYRPMYWFSLALDRHLWNLGAAGFHFTNLALHLANGILLFALLCRMGQSSPVSGSIALLWLTLPINVEVIAWVSARSYSLATAFLLLGLLCALHYVRHGRRPALLLYGLLCLLALLSNEIGFFMLPLTALLFLDRKIVARLAAPLLGIAFLTSIAVSFLRRSLGLQQSVFMGSYNVIGAEFWKYLGWMLAPIHMSVERSTSVPTHLPRMEAALAWLGLLAVPVFAIVIRRRAPLAAFGLLWISACLLPFCGFTFVYQGMAERFTYPATLGLAIAVAGAVLASPLSVRNGLLAALALWIFWGGWRGAVRSADWTDPVALYQHSLEANPDSPSLAFNLGFSLKQAGDLPGAEHAFLRVLQLRPGYPRVNASLGDVYLAEGRLADAQSRYTAELTTDPDAYQTLLNSAVAFQRAGFVSQAEEQDKKAISVAPGESGAYTNLGALYLEQNRVADAADMFTRAIQAQPTDPSPYFDLAVLYQGAHRPDQARPLYEKVLALKPGDPDSLANLAAMR